MRRRSKSRLGLPQIYFFSPCLQHFPKLTGQGEKGEGEGKEGGRPYITASKEGKEGPGNWEGGRVGSECAGGASSLHKRDAVVMMEGGGEGGRREGKKSGIKERGSGCRKRRTFLKGGSSVHRSEERLSRKKNKRLQRRIRARWHQ